MSESPNNIGTNRDPFWSEITTHSDDEISTSESQSESDKTNDIAQSNFFDLTKTKIFDDSPLNNSDSDFDHQVALVKDPGIFEELTTAKTKYKSNKPGDTIDLKGLADLKISINAFEKKMEDGPLPIFIGYYFMKIFNIGSVGETLSLYNTEVQSLTKENQLGMDVMIFNSIFSDPIQYTTRPLPKSSNEVPVKLPEIKRWVLAYIKNLEHIPFANGHLSQDRIKELSEQPAPKKDSSLAEIEEKGIIQIKIEEKGEPQIKDYLKNLKKKFPDKDFLDEENIDATSANLNVYSKSAKLRLPSKAIDHHVENMTKLDLVAEIYFNKWISTIDLQSYIENDNKTTSSNEETI